MAPETTAPLIEFLVEPPVNMGEEGELIDALGVMDAEGMDDIEPEAMAMGMEPERMGIGMDDMEPEGMAMGIEDMEDMEPEGIEPEGIDMDMDMLLIPIPIPMLPSFLASTYETYPVSNHFHILSREKRGDRVELHTSMIAGPATMLSSVA